MAVSARDYFAGRALSGLLANNEWLVAVREVESSGAKAAALIAHAAYTYADAMLKDKKEAA